MPDPFALHSDSPIASARRLLAIQPDDRQPLLHTSKALYIGGGGDVLVRAVGDTADVRFVGVPTRTILPVQTSHVRLTGTTASGLIALY